MSGFWPVSVSAIRTEGEVLPHHLSSSVHWDWASGQICAGLQTPQEPVSHHGAKGGSCLQVTVTAPNWLICSCSTAQPVCSKACGTSGDVWAKASHTEWLTHIPVLLWIFSSPHILGNWWEGLLQTLKRGGWNMLLQIWPAQWTHYIQQEPFLWILRLIIRPKLRKRERRSPTSWILLWSSHVPGCWRGQDSSHKSHLCSQESTTCHTMATVRC